MTGCSARQATVTKLPAGVTQAQVQSWDAAVSDLHKLSVATTNLRQGIISLHTTVNASGQPMIPDGTVYQDMLTTIGHIDQIQIAAAGYLSTIPNNWSSPVKSQVAEYMAEVTMALNQLISDGAIGVKDSNSRQQLTTLTTEITSLVKIIMSL
jgi:hypothetical protein